MKTSLLVKILNDSIRADGDLDVKICAISDEEQADCVGIFTCVKEDNDESFVLLCDAEAVENFSE